MPVLASASVDEIPIYREGATDEESGALAAHDPVGFHLRAFRAMGPVYRTQMGEKLMVVLAGLESNEFIWKSTNLWTYYNLLAGFREEMGDDHVTAIDGAHHRQKRTILKPAFDQAPAMRYLPAYNSIFHERLKATPSAGNIDLVLWWAKTLLWTQSRTVAKAEISEELLAPLIAWETALLAGIRYKPEERARYYNTEGYLKLKSVGMELLARTLDQRLAAPEKYDDNFSQVMRARREAEGDALSRDNLIDDLYLVLVAGVENTSKLLSACVLSILRDPAWLAELRTELDAWDGRDVMALAQMNRLKATVMETQRLYPTIVYNARESVQEFEFGGYQMPTGTVLVHMQILCHYLDEFYPDPLSFKPQRFVEEGRFVAKTNGIFGGGTHVCLGRNHTLMQTPIALAHMFKYYDLELIQEKPVTGDAPLLPGGNLKELWVRVTPRKS